MREHFPAVALAERGSLNVADYLSWTDDIFAGPRGGAYINNNPGASLTGAIPLLLLRPVLARVDNWNRQLPRPDTSGHDGELFWRTLHEGRAYYFLLVAFLTVALVMAPATAGTAACLCSRLMQSGVSAAASACAALLYGIGTPVLFRTGHLNHNLLAGDAGFTALLLLWDPGDQPLRAWRALVAGLLGGYSVLCDYSGVVIVVVVAFYVYLRGGRGVRSVALYAAGVAPGIAALALYQWWAFGSPFRPSQHYMTPTLHTAQGYRGFDWPSPALAWANFFDPRFGLFAYCPALMLGLLAPFRAAKREAWILFLYFALFVLFCAANRYSWLQPLTGFRYLVPVVPALALLTMQVAQSFPRILRRILGLAACAQSLIVVMAHENDIRDALGTILNRHFALAWMIRLRQAGAPVNWVWTAVTFASALLALALIWAAPLRARGKLE